MRRVLMLFAFVFSAAPFAAHHNVTQIYDAIRPVPLIGTVTAFEYRNPHTFIFVDAKDSAGAVVNWKVELLAGLMLNREGITRDSLHVGDAISMTACLAKDGSHTATAQFIFIPSAFENHRAGLCKAVSPPTR